MRAEVEWMLEKIKESDPHGTALDYGPLEGEELLALAGMGLDVTAMNLLGKTPVEGVEYIPPGELAKLGTYDLVICAHVLALNGARTAVALAALLKPGCSLWMCVPVGLPQIQFSRFYGWMRVFSRDEVTNLFAGYAALESEHYLPASWEAMKERPGILNKEIVQVGVFQFKNPQAKRKGKRNGGIQLPVAEAPIEDLATFQDIDPASIYPGLPAGIGG